ATAPLTLSRQASTDLQAGVVAVAESAAAGDQATALTRLDELQERLDAAVAAGDVTAERAASIQGAIEVVRADLQPAPTPSIEPVPQPTVGPGLTDDGNDNSGPGNSNGNGNGNGNSGNGKGRGD
ncbi:MAG: hypothetical protein WAZ28_03650, partial [Microbacterium sp.]